MRDSGGKQGVEMQRKDEVKMLPSLTGLYVVR